MQKRTLLVDSIVFTSKLQYFIQLRTWYRFDFRTVPMQIPITDYMKSVRRFILYLVDTLSRYLLRERNISFDKNNTKNPILTLKLTIRKETYSSILSKSVSCYCFFPINNGIFHSQGRLDTFEVLERNYKLENIL